VSVYFVVLAVAAVATFVLCFPVRWFAVRIGAVVHPDARRVHTRPTPTIGGSAMFLAFLITMVVASRLGALAPVFKQSSEPLGVVLGAAAIFVVGLVDDLRDMSAPAKVAGQVFAAMILYFLGVTMYTFKIPFVSGLIVLSPSILPLVTAIWVIGMANAVNLIDGLDGLAAGIVAIGSGALAIYALRLENLAILPVGDIGPLVAVITCGVCIGFLPHNFNPARIFMGDAGALFLGLLMACATMEVGGQMPETQGVAYFFWAPILIPVFILGVPIVDTAFAIVRRTVRRVSLTHPDRGHLHHQLMRLGHGQRRAVLILWAWTALISGLVLYPTLDPQARFGRQTLLLGIAVLAVVLYTLFRPGRRRRAAAEQANPTASPTPSATPAPAPVATELLASTDTDAADREEELADSGAEASSCSVGQLDARMARLRPDRDGATRQPASWRGSSTPTTDQEPAPPRTRLAIPSRPDASETTR
jgi:UDP-GlcNAc:undecaprenyl-phosphate/decaprenyl-phosphate GlcNAc-1-phosphate transferase